jgi:uncharacterized protein
MTPEVLASFIQQYIAAQDVPLISFAWQGGEPMLAGLDFYRRVIELQARFANGKRIENAFQTNGILIDDEWAAFFAENRFLIGLSIDGPREIHDRHRVDRGGQASFARVFRGLECLKKAGAQFNTLCVVHRDNAQSPRDVYRFLRDAGSRYMQFIPIVERERRTPGLAGDILAHPTLPGAEARVTDWSVPADAWGYFLSTIFDEWVRKDVGKVFVQLFDVALEAWSGLTPSLCCFRQVCGAALAVEHNGDLYSCDHYVFPENKLGNILATPLDELVRSPRQLQFGADKMRLPSMCQGCDVLFACRGECPKNRFLATPDQERGLNYLCAGYRRFFRYIDAPMRFMAEELKAERAPANVMRWIKDHPQPAPQRTRPAPNALCPCGSGKKFRNCCAGCA